MIFAYYKKICARRFGAIGYAASLFLFHETLQGSVEDMLCRAGPVLKKKVDMVEGKDCDQQPQVVFEGKFNQQPQGMVGGRDNDQQPQGAVERRGCDQYPQGVVGGGAVTSSHRVWLRVGAVISSHRIDQNQGCLL